MNDLTIQIAEPNERYTSSKGSKASEKTLTYFFWCSSAFLLLCFFVIFKCMAFVEPRERLLINDFLHPVLPPPRDLSHFIFLATYSATIVSIYFLLKRGLYIAGIVFFSYGFLLLCRSLAIVLIPLEPPVEMVLLKDPFVSFFSSENIVYTKDLFFSGHTASMFFFYFLTNRKWLKNLLFFMAIFVVIAVSIQRVHYTIDIIGGILAAKMCFMLVQYLAKKWRSNFMWPVFQKSMVVGKLNLFLLPKNHCKKKPSDWSG